MKRFVVSLVAVVTAAALLGAFPAIVEAHDRVFPFIGSAEVTPNPNVPGMFIGTGEGTVIGRFTEDASLTVNGNGFSAIVTLTAANGDQVFKMAEGTIISTPTSTIFDGTFTIMGGTGRFRKATGTGIVVMVVLTADPTHIPQFYDGTIEF